MQFSVIRNFVLALLAAATICQAGMKVDSKSYGELDLSAGSTYRWSTNQEAGSGHPLATGAPLDRRLRATLEDQLAKRGVAPAGDGDPDFLILCIAILKEVQSIGGVKKEIGGGVTWVGDVGAHGITAYRQGTLIIEIKEAGSDKPLWAGWASDAMPTVPDPDKVGKKAEKALKKILKRLP